MKFRHYRGKRVDNNEWIYGDLWRKKKFPNTCYIYVESEKEGQEDEGWVEVKSESVGQYIGGKSWNGKNIYSNSIIEIDDRTFNIEYRKESCSYILVDVNNPIIRQFSMLGAEGSDNEIYYRDVEIIGESSDDISVEYEGVFKKQLFKYVYQQMGIEEEHFLKLPLNIQWGIIKTFKPNLTLLMNNVHDSPALIKKDIEEFQKNYNKQS